jgi:hypothetical protein
MHGTLFNLVAPICHKIYNPRQIISASWLIELCLLPDARLDNHVNNAVRNWSPSLWKLVLIWA